MTIEEFLEALRNSPESIQFSEVMSVIEQNFQYQPTEFKHGEGETAVIIHRRGLLSFVGS